MVKRSWNIEEQWNNTEMILHFAKCKSSLIDLILTLAKFKVKSTKRKPAEVWRKRGWALQVKKCLHHHTSNSARQGFCFGSKSKLLVKNGRKSLRFRWSQWKWKSLTTRKSINYFLKMMNNSFLLTFCSVLMWVPDLHQTTSNLSAELFEESALSKYLPHLMHCLFIQPAGRWQKELKMSSGKHCAFVSCTLAVTVSCWEVFTYPRKVALYKSQISQISSYSNFLDEVLH